MSQVDLNAIGTDCSAAFSDGQVTYPSGGLTPFRMTCASGRQIVRDDAYLRAFTYGYDNTSGVTRASAFGDESEAADRTGPGCSISIAVMYAA